MKLRDRVVRDHWQNSERGSAMAEFVMVAALVVLIVASLLQLVLILHVRNTLIDAAGEGARLAGRVDVSLDEGVGHTRDLIGSALHARYAEDVTASTSLIDDMEIVVVTVQAPLPMIGLIGPASRLSVQGRAVAEVNW